MSRLRAIEIDDRDRIPHTPEDFLRWLGGPAILRVPGRDGARTRAVSTLLHGNEPSGLRALHRMLREGFVPAVDLVAFIGSVEAALSPPVFSRRALPDHPDLNRCFAPPFEQAERALAGQVLDQLRGAAPEALVDVHNTTGHTPPYGVGTIVADPQLHLVSLFASAYVHSDLRLGTLVEATEHEFPSVVIECGMAGEAASDALAKAGLERYLGAGDLEPIREAVSGITVVGRPIRVNIRTGARMAFGDAPVPGADITIRSDIDGENFKPMPRGAVVGWLSGGAWPLWAVGVEGQDVSRDLFAARGEILETRRDIIPIMMTTDPEIALSDCLFYVVFPEGG
ncbi:MAG: succinylglutamate desuccinylase/aspartoacylase family protein [Deltaproteobacteria bacterium]|nr:succinylglutamate desuccinylase/aspartoacylase family protein [Deltaproteobacteria bacterium]